MSTDLRSITSIDQLLSFLRDELEWPIAGYEKDDVTFSYEPAELGLKDEDAAAIRAIYQLRPLHPAQPWGIFFVEFEKKKLPIVVLRRILSHLVIKKRASANKAHRAAWNAEDLLFVSAFGDVAQDDREIAFAHFHTESGDLPTLRVLGWDGGDTRLKLDYVARELKHKLHWPDKPADAATWRAQWSRAFRHRVGHVIRTSDALATELAALARRIRDAAQTMLKAESDNGPITRLYQAFQTALIHDLTRESFADTYAQTITYGLLTAAISKTEMSEGRNGTALIAENVTDMVPITNPFLKEMLEEFLKLGGRRGGINFDELGVQDVVELLRGSETDLPAVIRDFGNRNPDEDPVIHFYEDFLFAYDKSEKKKRGVFYTPQPVVSYIVRSVHEFLQSEFGLADGLADTVTWGEMLKRRPGLVLPPFTDEPGEKRTISPDEPFIQILDPATGTATFLVEVIEVIHRTLAAKWKQQSLTDVQQRSAWNDYVPRHLLPRLHAFELMMAPYAIAHMKIGLKLAETGYRFSTEERARIYLTNALEPWVKQLPLIGFDALAHEAAAVNEIKRHKRFTVVIGNPPYSKMSGNLGKHAVSLIEQFRYVDRERIVERGALALELNLQDDYVKFWALLRHALLTTDVGVGAYITNSRYLASPTLRGLRWNLKVLFDHGKFFDLGGQVSERAAAGGADENVFDIEQGVAVGIGVRKEQHSDLVSVSYDRCRGTREEKYNLLNTATASSLKTAVLLEPPFFRFSRGVDEAESMFSEWHDLNEIMPFNSGCIITSRDNLALDFDGAALLEKIGRFAKSPRGDRAIERDIGYSSKAKWDVEGCKASIRSDPDQSKKVRRVLYRPFDDRWIYYSTKLLDTPSKPVCDSVFGHENIVLLTPKVNTSETFNHILVARTPAEKKSCSHDRATQMFPLYRYDSGLIKGAQPNIGRAFESAARGVVGVAATPESCLEYIYAVLHSPEYRRRFGNALRDSYPRIPVTSQSELFRTLVRLGRELTALHLLESPRLAQPVTEFVGDRTPVVEKISWSRDTVWVDKAQTIGFRGVREEVWNFHVGGYQVCEKWLKDRKGRTLSKDDLAHYHKIVVALSETIRLMGLIDEAIAKHGGWPEAFEAARA